MERTTERTYTLEEIRDALPFPVKATPELKKQVQVAIIASERKRMNTDMVCEFATMLKMDSIAIDAIPLVSLAFAAGAAYSYQDLWERVEAAFADLEAGEDY